MMCKTNSHYEKYELYKLGFVPSAFVGLMSMVTGSTLQEDIAATARQLRGRNILGCVSPEITQNANPTPCHDPQTSPAAGAAASHSPKLQLGGPSISP